MNKQENIMSKFTDKYILIPYGQRIPICKGCPNEQGWCGTPCMSCNLKEAWDKKYVLHLVLWGEYEIYVRKETNDE